MHSGLAQMLDRIARDPSNKVLTDRFISLVQDLEADADKAAQILALAERLLHTNPKEAMQYAYMVFQYDAGSTDALMLVASALKVLGRYGKSEVIKNEIAKIHELKEKNKITEQQVDQFVTEVTSIRFIDPPKKEDLRKTVPMDELASLSGQQRQVELDMDLSKIAKSPLPPRARPKGVDPAPRSSNEPILKEPAPTFDITRPPEEGTQISQISPVEAPPRRAEVQQPPVEEKAKNYEPVPAVLDSMAADVKPWMKLNYIRNSITGNSTLEQCEKAYAAALKLWPSLGLIGFVWKPVDGVDAFVHLIHRRPPMKDLLRSSLSATLVDDSLANG